MSQLTRPVCVSHAVEMRCAKNGYRVQVDADFGPYEVHAGDMYECPVGGEQIVTGWASQALAMHFEPDFATCAETAELTVTA